MRIFIAIVLVVFFYKHAQAQAQWDYNTAVSYKGQVLIVDRQCKRVDNQIVDDLSGSKQAILKLGPIGRAKVKAALYKALEWAQINAEHNLSFKKLIVEVPAKASIYGLMGDGGYKAVAVIFHAFNGGN